jgi:putative inorganic carbon (HCO3(-)) transporter
VKVTNQSIRRRYLLYEFLLIIFGSYLLLIASTKSNQLNPAIVLINAILLSLLVVFLIIKQESNTGVEKPLALMFAVMLLASLVSIDPRRSMGEFGLVAIPICLFFSVSEWVKRGLPKELVIKALLTIGAIFMVLSWNEAIAWYMSWMSSNPGIWFPSVSFRLTNPNIIAMLMNVWLVLAGARLMVTRTISGRIILGVFCISALGIIFLTSSRGGWMGTAAGLACLGLIFLRNRKEQWLPLWQKLKSSQALIGGSATLLIMVISAGGFLLFRQLTHPSHGTRTEFWTPAWQAFIGTPLLGKGPFTFISAYLQANSVPPRVPFDYAHSIYMDLLSGVGLLGLAAFLWLIFVVVRKTLTRVQEDNGQDWAVALGALASLVTFTTHGFVDSVHHSEPISLWNICIVFGAALATLTQVKEPSRTGRIFTICLSLMAVGLTWFSWWTLLPMKAGEEMANLGNWSEASEMFEQAVKRDGKMASAYQQLGLAQSMLAVTDHEGALDEGIHYFEKTIELDPYWGLNQANLAALYLAAGRTEEAKIGFRKAVDLAPRSDVFSLNLGAVQETLGDFSGAAQTYQLVFTNNPDWQEAGYWRENPFRFKTLKEWQSLQPINEKVNLSSLKSAVEARPDSLSPYLHLIQAYLQEGMLIEAKETLIRSEFATTESNIERTEHAWLKSEILAADGDYSGAIDLGQTVIDAYLKYGLFGPSTSVNQIYNAYMFRRPAAKIDFVPQMKVIAWPDKWGRRALKLADWMELNGDQAGADKWREVVSKAIPDLPSP